VRDRAGGLRRARPRLYRARAAREPWRAAAARGAEGEGLPDLLELGDIRGDLHSHTVASDGRNSIEEMAVAARELGYEYLAITDHSASHGFGNAVSPEQLLRQID